MHQPQGKQVYLLIGIHFKTEEKRKNKLLVEILKRLLPFRGHQEFSGIDLMAN